MRSTASAWAGSVELSAVVCATPGKANDTQARAARPSNDAPIKVDGVIRSLPNTRRYPPHQRRYGDTPLQKVTGVVPNTFDRREVAVTTNEELAPQPIGIDQKEASFGGVVDPALDLYSARVESALGGC